MTRREDWVYQLATGQRLPGIHPGMVTELVHTLQYYGFQPGPRAEDGAARAIAAVFAWMEKQEAEDQAHERRHEESARQLSSDLEQARRRTAVRVTVSGSQR